MQQLDPTDIKTSPTQLVNFAQSAQVSEYLKGGQVLSPNCNLILDRQANSSPMVDPSEQPPKAVISSFSPALLDSGLLHYQQRN